MRFASFNWNGRRGLAVDAGEAQFVGRYSGDHHYPGDLHNLIESGRAGLVTGYEQLLSGDPIDMSSVLRLPPIPTPEKIICVGLNYLDHTSESGFVQPDYPTLFTRVNSSLVGDGAPIVRPKASEQLDYEGELVAIIGRGGRHIKRADALDHVAGYSIFNDASIRDYQFKTPQWTVGKNFDGTGAFGPVFVTADELPDGCKGLKLETRLNGTTVQSALIASMVFDVASQIEIISEAITLAPGDLLVTGTPSGVGLARKPPLWMKPGDICEVEIERIGVLRNPIVDEVRPQ
jgi:acylpyruvate hydrolase